MAKSNYQRVKEWRKKFPEKWASQCARRLKNNRAKVYAQQKRWRDANARTIRAKVAARKRKERLTKPEMQKIRMERYKAKQEALLVELAGRPRSEVCELCDEKARTVFDHDHATGVFRGWLCDRCNRTLGQVKDSPELLRKLIAYLEAGGRGRGSLKRIDTLRLVG